MSYTNDSIRLTLREKLSYGSGNISLGIVFYMASFYLLFFYSDVIGLNPALVGIAILIGKFWDAITDPLMGYMSDHTVSKHGRRRLYLLIGAVPLAVLFFFTWAPPAFLTETPGIPLFIYLILIWMLLNTGFTVIAVPYYSLGAELTTDPDERSSAFAFNFMGQRIGMLMGILLPNLAIEFADVIVEFLHKNFGLFTSEEAKAVAIYIADPENAYRWIAAFLSLIIVVSILGTFKGTKERIKTKVEPWSGDIRKTFKDVFGDFKKAIKESRFRTLLIATLVADANGGITMAMLPYVVKYWLGMDEIFSPLMGLCMISGIFFAFGWVWLSKRIGKKNVMLISIFLYGATLTGYMLMGPGLIFRLVIFMLFLGASISGYMMIWSLLADIVDYDEYKTHKRHEGSFFGLYTFTSKLAMAVGVMASGFFLDFIDLEKSVVVTDAMINWMIIFVGPFAGGLNFISFFIFLKFDYSKKEHDRIQKAIADRKNVKYNKEELIAS